MRFDLTIGTSSSNLLRSLASKFKACNSQGRKMICLCLSLSKQQNLIIVLGLSVQQHLIWVQVMQLELKMFDTSNNKIFTVPLSCRDTTFLLLKLICCSNPSLIHMNILTLSVTLASMQISFTTDIWKQPSSRYNQARRTP